MKPPRRLYLAAAIACCAALAAMPGTTSASGPMVFRGLGTWVDIFDAPVFSSINASVAAMKSKGVHTIYVETANARSSGTMSFRTQQGQLLERAHDNGIKVVAWTLPGHTNPADDRAKAFAALDFRSSRGDYFNGFALDIESTSVKPVSTRNQRLLTLSSQIKKRAGGRPLGAITFSPVFIDGPWPSFPWQKLAKTYDTFLPMVYSSYHYNTEKSVRDYTARAIALLRAKTSATQSIHVVGGIADKLTPAEVRGFVTSVRKGKVSGGSLYDYRTTGSGSWAFLKKL